MIDIFKKDITIKIISILIAVLLWSVVLNIDNPFGTINIDIPLTIQNQDKLLEKGLALKSCPKSISVTLKGRKDKINNISINDLNAILDLSDISSVDSKQLSAKVFISKGDVVLDNPGQLIVNIELEKLIENSFPVVIETSGNLKSGYSIVRKTAVPETVSFQGMESVINSIGMVKVLVNVNDLDGDRSIKTECVVYNKDKEPKEIAGLGKNRFVDVKLEVAKEVDIKPVITGKPADDYVFIGAGVSPDKAYIRGTPEAMARVNELSLEPLNINNVNSNVDTTRPLVLPEGVELYNTPRNVNISAVVEQLAYKSFTISKDNILLVNAGNDSTMTYEIVTQNIIIGVKGKKADLEQVSISTLKPSIDVDKLNEGTSSVPLKVTLPESAKLVEEYNVEVKINKR